MKNTWQRNTDSPNAAMQLTIFLHSFEAPTGTFILSWRIGHLVGSTRGAVWKINQVFELWRFKACANFYLLWSLGTYPITWIFYVLCSCSDGCYEKDGLVEKLWQNIAFQEVAPVLPWYKHHSVDNTPGEFAQIEKFRQKPFEFPLRSLTASGRKSQEIHSANLCKSLQDTQARTWMCQWHFWPPMVVSHKAHVPGTPTWSQVPLLVSELLELYSAQPQVVSDLPTAQSTFMFKSTELDSLEVTFTTRHSFQKVALFLHSKNIPTLRNTLSCSAWDSEASETPPLWHDIHASELSMKLFHKYTLCLYGTLSTQPMIPSLHESVATCYGSPVAGGSHGCLHVSLFKKMLNKTQGHWT